MSAINSNYMDPLKTAHDLRQQRCSMIYSIEQYKVAHLIMVDCTSGLFPTVQINEEMHDAVRKLTEQPNLKIQMKYLKNCEWQKQLILPAREELSRNDLQPNKNRCSDIIPGVHGAVVLTKYPLNNKKSSYINAVKVDGFHCMDRFIVTQHPMPNTLGDFWRMIVLKNIAVIVNLNKINCLDKTSCEFWPSEETPVICPVNFIILEHVDTEDKGFYEKIWLRMTIKGVDTKTAFVNVISFNNWISGESIPRSILQFLEFFDHADNLSRQQQPTVLTCFDGASACGIYAALSFLIEKMKLENCFDVCEAIKIIRRNRKQFITDEEQLTFLYRAVLKYILDRLDHVPSGYTNYMYDNNYIE